MTDDFRISPETMALATLAGRLANAVFDKALEGDSEGFEAEADAALAEAVPGMTADDARRQSDAIRLFKQILRTGEAAGVAQREGRADDEARLLQEMKAQQRERVEISSYLGFSAAAEALHRAKDLDAFLAALPGVDLSRLHGNGSKLPPFPFAWAIEARVRPLERVQAMLDAGAALDLVTRFPKFTLLHWIAQSRRKGRDTRLAIVRLLVEKGADLEAQDFFARTPMHVAIQLGSADDLVVLLQAGADVRRLSWEGGMKYDRDPQRSPLMQAAHDPAKVQLLLDHGADPRQLAADGTDLRLHLRQQMAQVRQWIAELPAKKRDSHPMNKGLAALAASLALVEPLMAPPPAAPQHKLTFQEAPEDFYALQNDIPLDDYRAALARIDITTYSAPNGDCPIYWPIRAKADRPQKLWLMLQAGASVQGDPGNGTALHILADQRSKDVAGQKAMVQMLLQSGAVIEARDYQGETPLARAVSEGGPAEVAALLAAGASVGVKTVVGLSQPRRVPLLMLAADRPKIFRLLLDHGADPNPPRRSIAESIALEVADLDAALLDDLSGNCRRQIETSRRGYLASLAMLQAKAPHAF